MLVEVVIVMDGTTSACAENTSMDAAKGSIQLNYLRVRGEYPVSFTHR